MKFFEMPRYLETVDERVKQYFDILSKDKPLWLDELLEAPELLQQQHISITCGTIYSDLFPSKFLYSSLEHSIAVALIIRKFTHDDKQALSWLFHDIATPAFKHCIDFLNWDHEKQESTEDLTAEIISNSELISSFLKRNWIAESEVNDYQIYPIADNKSPKLSSDRLEYSLSNGLFSYNLLNIDEVSQIYNDVYVTKNEDGIDELAFKTLSIAKKFIEVVGNLSVIYIEDRTRYSMQFIAEIVKRLGEEWLIKKSDLYHLSEAEIMFIIDKSRYSEIFNKWKTAKEVVVSKTKPEDVFYINLSSKIRYINPLVGGKRIYDIDEESRKVIDSVLNYDMSNYVYIPGIKF